MKNGWIPYAGVAVLSIGAGVAIAGLPDNTSVDAVIIAPSATAASDTTVAESTPDTTNASAGETTTPSATTTPASTTATPTPTSPSTTPTTPSTTTPPDDLVARADLIVTAANGANVAGTAARSAEFLESIGYVDVVPRDGTAVENVTVIYFADGFQREADRLAADWDLLPQFVAPIDVAPTVLELPADTQLLAYVGLDRA